MKERGNPIYPAEAPTLAYQSPTAVTNQVTGHWANRSERFLAGLVDWVTFWTGGFVFGLAGLFVLGVTESPRVILYIVPALWLLAHLALDGICGRTFGRYGADLAVCTDARRMPTKLQLLIRATLQRPWILFVLAVLSMASPIELVHLHLRSPLGHAMPWVIGACGLWWALNAMLCVAQNLTLVDRISRTRLVRIEEA